MEDYNDKPQLTKDVCIEYSRKANLLSEDRQDVGPRRALRIELQTKYEIPEIWAINILNGVHINEYVRILEEANKAAEEKKEKNAKKEKKKEKQDFGIPDDEDF